MRAGFRTGLGAAGRPGRHGGAHASLRLLSIVAASDGDEACACDLTEPVGLSQPTVSHHLKILMDANYLTRSKRGTWAYYKLVLGSLDRVSALLATATA
ncbi:ArsR/SmtB family transcription factor [Leifsonia sp. L25]|uniref:ArsR/SmtB family transcription factor n=1 Tax=Actinomycetes TaxID=1760 RepID=UPI003D69A61D